MTISPLFSLIVVSKNTSSDVLSPPTRMEIKKTSPRPSSLPSSILNTVPLSSSPPKRSERRTDDVSTSNPPRPSLPRRGREKDFQAPVRIPHDPLQREDPRETSAWSGEGVRPLFHSDRGSLETSADDPNRFDRNRHII
jgi:hypothetical protein